VIEQEQLMRAMISLVFERVVKVNNTVNTLYVTVSGPFGFMLLGGLIGKKR